ncbi:cytochrome c biogenesis protein DipZ [Demequina aurantiaca]|uniref:cytochrome c biogenesis protein DipZ n=1 Tax=Demequina aurantiaca TaxID=676200 RepID=UPI000785A06D|nr:cytochrome c biogenesis protein DipZ [Demequina aurantiaca]
MFTLILVGLVSGIITAISPCVLPVLPAILTSSIQDGAANKRRPYVVVGGLVVSFAVFTLIGGVLISLLGLPDDVLRWAGIITLAIVGLGLAVPAVGHILEKPFVNTKIPTLNRDGNGFIMGLALGLVFVPCAGPILASITVLAATNGISWGLVVLTMSFSLGIAIPLLLFGVAGQSIGKRIKAVRERLQAIRIASGVILMLTALVIATNLAEPLQRSVPGFLANIQESIENNGNVQGELDNLAGREAAAPATGNALTFDECEKGDATVLQNCGPARDLPGIQEWLNTPNGEALDLDNLEGPVLLDFWTYSCINCQRTFPYLTAWDDRYRDDGLTIIGVHSPEFNFEKVVGNVEDATERYGIEYPVAIDNDFTTWREWDQRFWPAHYLIDQTGTVRQVHYGEGKYEATEKLIQQLLDAPPQEAVVADTGGHTQGRTPELYVGKGRLAAADNDEIVSGEATVYTGNATPAEDEFSFGGQWTVEGEYSTTGTDATLDLNFYAADVHLVMAGEGTVTVTLAGDSSYNEVVEIDGTSDLYDLYVGEPIDDTMHLEFSEGIEVYAFTFG